MAVINCYLVTHVKRSHVSRCHVERYHVVVGPVVGRARACFGRWFMLESYMHEP